jgi:predicted dehydrogenase
MTQIKTLVIGSGSRVKTTIIPALNCLSQKFKITGVYSRSQQSLEDLEKVWNLKTSNNLKDFDFPDIQLIIVAITTTNIPQVLAQLCEYDLKDKILMLDTPVLSSIKHLYCLNKFKKFKQVLVSEDCIALPQFLIAKDLIEQGKIGQLKKIWLFHSGYKFHGIALLRSLVSQQHILKTKTTHYGEKRFEFLIEFPNSVTATVIEPRDYNIGRFMIAGSKGIITDYPLNSSENIEIGYAFQDQKLQGLTINGVLQEHNALDQAFYQNLCYEKLPKFTLMNLMKIRGLMEILDSLEQEESPFQYQVSDGLYDAILSIAISRLAFWYDILALFNSSVIKFLFINILPKILRFKEQ